MRETIKLRLISDQEHNSQIVTGFLMLKHRYDIEIHNDIQPRGQRRFAVPHIVECEYAGKRIAYDTSDGYFVGMENWVKDYDYYFKRSYSEKKNVQLFGEELSKRIYPLGFNYFVTCPGNPYGETSKNWKTYARILLGRKEKSYYTPDKFQYHDAQANKVVFFTRLWRPEEYLSEQTNAQRKTINAMRVELLRKLKEELGDKFIGGLSPSDYERKMAPDLIMPKRLTRRENYLKLMHSCSIAIGTTGLHDSIGWKTGEYVAAGKAIINERFCYEVPGDFCEGTNYLPFESIEECLRHVKFLLDNPKEVERMQMHNRRYYNEYLMPEKLIVRTLDFVKAKENL